eukprot:gene4706-6606_t
MDDNTNPFDDSNNPFADESDNIVSAPPEDEAQDSDFKGSTSVSSQKADHLLSVSSTEQSYFPRTSRSTSPPPTRSPKSSELHRKASTLLTSVNDDWSFEWSSAAEQIMAKNDKISLTLCSPEVVSSMMSKYVVYTVKTEPYGYAVRRRYNDFAWLREVLVNRYDGMFIPMLPATTTFSQKYATGGKYDVSGEFIKNRLAQLGLFLEQISKIPFLRTDPSLLSFISVQSDKEFKQIVETTPSTSSYSSISALKKSTSHDESTSGIENNEGLKLWKSLLKTNEFNNEVDRLISDFKRQLDLLKTVFESLGKECINCGRRAIAFSVSMNTLSEQIANWSDLEHNLLDPNKNEYINSNATKMKIYLPALVAGSHHWAQHISLTPKVLARVIMSNVQYQLVQVEGFRTHIVNREIIAKELEKAQKEKQKIIDDKAKAAATEKKGLFAKGVDELEEALNKKSDQVYNLQELLNRVTKALVFCEIDRFNTERLGSITQLLGSLAVSNMQICQSSTAKWSQIVTESSLDPAEFLDCINQPNHSAYSTLNESYVFGDN